MTSKKLIPALSAALAVSAAAAVIPEDVLSAPAKDWAPGHYCRANITNGELIDNWSIEPCKNVPEFRGYVVDVYWEDVEPTKGGFRVTGMQRNIDIAKQHGKEIMFRLADVEAGPNAHAHLPNWILNDKKKYGGAFYRGKTNSTYSPTYPTSWDPDYQAEWTRYVRQVAAWLNRQPTVAGIIFLESSRFPPGNNKNWAPDGPRSQVAFFEKQNKAAAEGAPNKVVIQYLNYIVNVPPALKNGLPGYIKNLGNGFGGPDIVNFEGKERWLLRDTGFRNAFLQNRSRSQFGKNQTALAAEAQNGAFKRGSAKQVFDYGVKEARLNFFIWTTGNRVRKSSGYTIHDVVKLLQSEGRKGPIINTVSPYPSFRPIP